MRLSPPALLSELEPTAARLVERHLATSKEWFPHELVPWSRGRDFEPGASWSPQDADLGGACLGEAARSALYVNLLTEDNLPYYFNDIDRVFGKDDAYGFWTRRWTAEEGRHSIAIRDYLTVSRAIDPWELERGRMVQVAGGNTPKPQSPQHGFCYLAIQELATRVSHLNTGKYSTDPVADKIMVRVATDENLHMVFYRDSIAALLEVEPSTVVKAITEQVLTFEMPGAGITGFTRKAAKMADAGIYDLRIHHDDIVWPLLRYWKVFERSGLDAEAEQARERLAGFLEKLESSARRYEEKRAARHEASAARAD